MACPEFEDLLTDYAELDIEQRYAVDAHMAVCDECRAFHEALADVDSAMTAAFAGVEAPADLPRAVIGRIGAPIRRPSFVPEILDLTGSVAVLAVALVLLAALVSSVPLDIPVYWPAGGLFLVSGIVFAYRSYADLKS
ncbi:MAG TPA: hypothetical protein VGV35_01540 [Bryobacteraceae bacterium]|nr:hypothetical protein [Bryobacteraceae bacterium]